MKIHRLNTILVLMIAALASCSKGEPSGVLHGPSLTVTPASFPSEPHPGAADGEGIRNMTAYLFRDGVLSAVQEMLPDGSGTYRMQTDGLSGTVYFIGNADDNFDLPATPDPALTEELWLNKTVAVSDAGCPPLFFTAKTVLDVSSGKSMNVKAKYGLARLDLKIQVSGDVAVNEFAVRNAALGSYIFQKGTVETPEGTLKDDIVMTFPEGLSEDMEGIAYLLEQAGIGLSVYAKVTIDGQVYEMESALPSSVRRNTVYSVTVRKESSRFGLAVEEWGEGEQTDLLPGFGGVIRIDEVSSPVPEKVQVADDGRTLILPHYATDFVMAVESDDQLEMFPVDNPWLKVEPSDASGDVGEMNRFRISKALSAPGTEDMAVPLYFHRKGLDNSYPEDVIKIVLKGNPVKLDGNISFGLGDYTYRFGRYVENQLEVFTVPDDKIISAEFDNDEDPWLKFVPADEPGRFRLLAGWKPNDPTASGREQAGKVVITALDGTDREEYIVTRLNYGLPVTFLHGTWWCKYNAMGNSKRFDDQILCSEDPARIQGKTVFEYLTTCSADEYYDLWGWAYQGDNGLGMRVIESEGKAVMDGFTRDINTHLNKLPPKLLAPDGYEVPSLEDFNRIFDATDYVWLMWDGPHTIRVPWEGHSRIYRQQKRRDDIMVGNINVNNLIYISMKSPDFPDDEGVVWYGPGAQWNNDGIFHNGHYNNILFTVYSPPGSGWFVGGGMNNLYLAKNGASNFDTRIIRFKKSPVEYIYGI